VMPCQCTVPHVALRQQLAVCTSWIYAEFTTQCSPFCMSIRCKIVLTLESGNYILAYQLVASYVVPLITTI
jgi:hypothetical protein